MLVKAGAHWVEVSIRVIPLVLAMATTDLLTYIESWPSFGIASMTAVGFNNFKCLKWSHCGGYTKVSFSEMCWFAQQSVGRECLLDYSNGLVQDCGISSAVALEIPQSCTKPSMECKILIRDKYIDICCTCVWDWFILECVCVLR